MGGKKGQPHRFRGWSLNLAAVILRLCFGLLLGFEVFASRLAFAALHRMDYRLEHRDGLYANLLQLRREVRERRLDQGGAKRRR